MASLKRISKGDRAVELVFYTILLLLIVVCAYPIWYCIVASISDGDYVNSGAFIILPRGVHFKGYSYAFEQKQLWIGYANTILYTVSGTVLGLFCCMPCGYALSRKDLPMRNLLMAFFVITMYFGGGLIPTYTVVNTLHLTNTRWILILFGSISVYNMIMIRTFCQANIPEELREAASIDGCGNMRFFTTIALPLAKPIIAVIALYVAVGHWNSYYNALVYTQDRVLQPLQMELRKLLFVNIGAEASDMDAADVEQIKKLVQVVKYCIIVLSSLPIMCLYPFLQKYFVQGVMIGSIKG